MPDISETLLQAAQVVNQSYSMLAQSQQAAAELAVRRKNYEDMAKSREEALGYKEQAMQEKAKADALSAANRSRELDIREQNAQTQEGQLAVSQGRLELGKYKAQQDTLYKENKFSKSEYDGLVERLDRTLIGMKTGQQDLDQTLIQLRTPQLQGELPKLLEAQSTGDLSQLGPQFKMAIAASNPGLLDKDKAAALASQVTRVLDFRKAQSDKIVEGYPERERNIIRGTSFLKDSLQTIDTTVQKQTSDQVNASANPRQQAMQAAVGTTQSPMAPPSPRIAIANDMVDRISAGQLETPEGLNQAADAGERALYDLEQAGERAAAAALIQKMGQRSPKLANKVAERRAARGQK